MTAYHDIRAGTLRTINLGETYIYPRALVYPMWSLVITFAENSIQGIQSQES